MLVKIVAVQARVGQPLTLEEKIHIFKQQPDFICLPEYYLLDRTISDYSRAALRVHEHLDYYRQLSSEFGTCLIGGSVVEPEHSKLFNTVHVFDRGEEIGKYRKRHPVERELQNGISPGDRHFVFDHEDVRVGVLICGDVFHGDRFAELGEHQCDIIFIPTTSPFRPDDTIDAKIERDRKYFVHGAHLSGAFVVKVGGVGEIFGRPLQGRSLIAAPWGVEQRVDFTAERDQRILSATLDLHELREFRRKMRTTAGSRPQ
jgi:N-carbamoylputrescine amidase